MTRGKKKTRAVAQPKAASSVAVRGEALSVKDVCDIIGACHQAKVSSLDFAGLSLRFQKALDVQSSEVLGRTDLPSPPVPQRVATPTGEQLREAQEALARRSADEAQSRELEMAEARDLYLENLKVNDPLEYERELMRSDDQ